ncbi:4-(cytidine 5'-diphospho)-2-C-methyl-D-erythritol kinase [bacterium]|jgi:4-diphosphocytidyl-2-C-methyl-D-erythritol kinase|nr:4-(cytidine 5'-diphospho)-2-C-methyl-D-erythritol kinase [bacterium]
MTTSSSIKSYAKLNLGLQVFPKNSSGLHPIQSIFQEISLYDTITVKKSDTPTCTITCSKESLATTNNLIVSAFNAFNPTFGLCVHLEKNIPLGAGLGGGSSNAAVILNWLNAIEKKYTDKTLNDIAYALGSDVPYFLNGGRANVTGTGNVIDPLKHVDQHFVIIYPSIHSDTGLVYNEFDTFEKTKIKTSKTLFNDLKKPAFNLYPKLKTIETTIQSLITNDVFMSGSGSTLYITDPSEEKCKLNAKKLKSLFPDFYIEHVKALSKR